MRASILPSLCAALLLSVTSPVLSQELTGKDVITALNLVSFKYEDFTVLVNAIPAKSRGSREAQKVVDEYGAFIVTQGGADNQVSPSADPYPVVEQFAVAAASHSLFLEDRRFQFGIVLKAASFSAAQKKKLSADISRQFFIIDGFQNLTETVLPDVAGILIADFGVVRETIKATVAALAK